MIELHFWEQLTTIAECGTLSAASEKLHLTQPALSRSMKRLEELLDVTLFERGKNKITLNETGKMAAEHAIRLLEHESDLVDKIRTYDQAHRTLGIGSCAPVPLREFVPHLMTRYPSQTISSELQSEEILLRKFHEGMLQMIILNHPIDEPDIRCRELMKEKMFFCVTKLNPLAGHKEVSLQDIDGQTILLYSKIGFWYDVFKEKLPHSRLLLQSEFDIFRELADASEFPFFVSDWHLKNSSLSEQRICIPITDTEASIIYYYISKKSARDYLK